MLFRSVPSPIYVDISYLRHPALQSVQVLPESYRAQVKEAVDYLADHQASRIGASWGFYDWEHAKMARLLEWMGQPVKEEELLAERANFYRYFNEYGKRRNLSFAEVFPEMREFWEECQALAAKADSLDLQQVRFAAKSDSLLLTK